MPNGREQKKKKKKLQKFPTIDLPYFHITLSSANGYLPPVFGVLLFV